MYERSRKKFIKLYAYAMILLSAMLLLISYTPLLRINLNGQERSEWFTEGSYTGSWETDSGMLELDFSTALQALKNWRELKKIIQVQNLESEIRVMKQNSEDDASWADDKTLQEKENALQQLYGKISPEEEAELRKMGEDSCFSGLLCAVDSCFSGKSARMTSGMGSLQTVRQLCPVFFLIYLIFLILFPVAAAIQMILKAAYLLIHSQKIGQREMEKLSAVPVCICYTVLNLAFWFGFLALGMHAECCVGSAVWLVALLVLVCTLNTVRKWAFKKTLPEHFWIRQGLAALSLVAVTAVIFGFAGLRLPNLLSQEADRFGTCYEQLRLEQDLREGIPYEAALVQAEDAVSQAVNEYGGAVSAVVLICFVGLALLLFGLLARFSSAKAVHRTLLPAAALLVLLMIAVPTFFGVGSSATQERYTQSGQPRVLWDAYRREGTEANREYRVELARQELLSERMEKLTAAVQDGTGDAVEELLREKSECATELAVAEQAVRQLKTHHIRNLILCIAGSAVFLLSELAGVLLSVSAERKKCADCE